MKFKLSLLIILMVLYFAGGTSLYSAQKGQQAGNRNVVNDAFSLLIHTSNQEAVNRALVVIEQHWQYTFIAQLLDIMSVPRNAYVFQKTIELLTAKTGEDFGRNINDWYF
ncbi:MAG: hypothetical protein KJO32_12565, partial [Deltaproteobacteria bacterium]|nr:hypothetical protein [Deltaproteobacteria bacterium]